MGEYTYVGSELDLFATAVNWKSYLRRLITPYLGTDVLEVGAGIGGTTKIFHHTAARTKRWVCLEPDPTLAESITKAVQEQTLPAFCEVAVGTLASLPEGDLFDTILYIDVLEHIEHDHDELEAAARHVRPGGYIVVLSPSHPFLYTPFDAALGHFRRYTKASLRAVGPEGCNLVRLTYHDAVGMFLSLGNRLFLKAAHPKPSQIALWDRVAVRASRVVDPVLGYLVGKSILGVWQKK